MRISRLFVPLAAAFIIAGCGDKGPAESSIAQAEAAMEKARPDAQQYAPNELKATDATLAKMKASLANKKYQAVLDAVPQFNDEYKVMADAVTTNQTVAAAAQTEWTTLNEQVPKTVEEIQARVDSLKPASLPNGITKETVETAKTELETMKSTWAEATAAASAGKTVEAAEKGRAVAAQGVELKNKLGMNEQLASTG